MRCHFGSRKGMWEFKAGEKSVQSHSCSPLNPDKTPENIPPFFPLYLSSESTEQWRIFLFLTRESLYLPQIYFLWSSRQQYCGWSSWSYCKEPLPFSSPHFHIIKRINLVYQKSLAFKNKNKSLCLWVYQLCLPAKQQKRLAPSASTPQCYSMTTENTKFIYSRLENSSASQPYYEWGVKCYSNLIKLYCRNLKPCYILIAELGLLLSFLKRTLKILNFLLL